jgi:hypothetical protein
MNDGLSMAARLVARMMLGVGLMLATAGCGSEILLYLQSSGGVEAVADIDAASRTALGTGGVLDLSWWDTRGARHEALGIEVTNDLSRKLRIGGTLARVQLRIRYRQVGNLPSVLVVEDVPAKFRHAGAMAIAGFLAITSSSAILLALALTRKPRDGREVS